ncbi:hypothetical protein PHYPSEUDO_009215 [Phytophthora pseudosyringae]|uniref:Uncharacterized protein n=1 Tax=Phytophthora pseudosyringae TaxID=221518 RepID=A0A8T1W8U4_9STRA|nr:hypothetical protein PHYPSEUDO_009215 [Phytophthora pseudosyringae]
MEYRVRKRDVGGAGRLPCSLEEVLPDAVVRRFLLRAGFCSSSDGASAAVRRHVSDFFRRIVGCMAVMMQHDGRRSFRLVDVKRACEHFGIRMYGYDDMCLLAAGRVGGPEAFHVTELVECSSLFSRPVDAPDEPDTEPGARFKKTDFVANYTAWKDEMGDVDDDVSEPSEWSFSDSDTESEGGQSMDTETSQPWQPDEEKFMASLRNAQELVDEKLLQEPEDEEPGQGYYSDFDDSYEPEYLAGQRTREEEEDAQWGKVGELHVLQSDEDSDPAELQEFSGSPNLYVISRQEFLRVFRALLNISLRMGELQISSVALSALHNATEQCLHRSLTEGSLHYQLAAILKGQENANSTNQLESELQMQREKVNELCETIAANKAAFKAKELAMQQQIEQLKKQLLGQHDVQMEASPILKKKKKSPGKRKSTSKDTHTVRKGLSKSSNGSTSVVGALRSRGQNHSGTKKVKVSLV